MTSRLNKVETGMDAVIHNFLPIHPVLLLKVRVETCLNVLDNRLPAGDIGEIALSGRIAHHEATLTIRRH